MEDAHATILDLDQPDESAEAQCGKGKKGKNSFFAVYDGHGGECVAPSLFIQHTIGIMGCSCILPALMLTCYHLSFPLCRQDQPLRDTREIQSIEGLKT